MIKSKIYGNFYGKALNDVTTSINTYIIRDGENWYMHGEESTQSPPINGVQISVEDKLKLYVTKETAAYNAATSTIDWRVEGENYAAVAPAPINYGMVYLSYAFLGENDGAFAAFARVHSDFTVTLRLDRELDGGEFGRNVYDQQGKDEIAAPLAPYVVELADADGSNSFGAEFIGTDSRALVRNFWANAGNSSFADSAIFKHSVALTEPTKLLEGYLIDGMGVSQPETDGVGYENHSGSGGELGNLSNLTGYHTYTFDTISGNYYFYNEVTYTIASPPLVYPMTVYVPARYNGAPAINAYTLTGVSGGSFTGFGRDYVAVLISPVRQRLTQVINRLLQGVNERTTSAFVLTAEEAVRRVLDGTISPEFKWSPQTTVWECLCDVGNVVDAIPRLRSEWFEGDYVVVTFDFVGETTSEAENLLDDKSIASYGESVDETQYNSRLGAIVENVLED